MLQNDGTIVVESSDVRLGSGSASDFVALSSKVDQFQAFVDATITGWVPVAGDGGAALKAAYVAARTPLYGAPGTPLPTTGATKVKGE